MNPRRRATRTIVLAVSMLFLLSCGIGPIFSPKATPNSTPAKPTSAGVLYQDTFDSNANGWETGDQSDTSGDLTAQIVDGKYLLALKSKQDYFYVISAIPNFSAKDFLFSIDATILTTTATPGDLALGFTLREANGVNGKRYEFLFYNDNHYVVSVWPSEDYKSVQQVMTGDMGSAKLESGITNTFAIQAKSSTFTLNINGNKMGSFTDSTVSEAGGMSLWVGLDKSTQSVIIDFDNLSITKVP